MNASDDEVFEDTIETLEAEVHTAIMTPKPKSATRAMTTYKTFCTSRVKAVNDAVKEYREKTLALKQIEHLESIRDRLTEQ